MAAIGAGWRARLAERRALMGLAGAASAALLLAAFAFQAAGYAPCELCLLQRWPHAAAVATGLLGWLTGRRGLAAAGLLAAVAAAGIAGYHTGVEQGWWPGPQACTSGAGAIAGLSVEELMARINAAPVVRCDEPALLILGLSMAAWNALASAALAGVWLVALLRR